MAKKRANAGRTKHLVPGKGGEVDAERVEIDGHVRHRLACVQDDKGSDAGPAQPNTDDCARHARHVGKRDDFRVHVNDTVRNGSVDVDTSVLRELKLSAHARLCVGTNFATG